MKLRDYLWEQGIRQEDFADTVDVGRTHLSCIITGKRKPGRKLARRIETATNGVIKAKECLNGNALGYNGKRKTVSGNRRKQTETPQKILSLI